MNKTDKTMKKVLKDKKVKGDRNQKIKRNLEASTAKRVAQQNSTGALRELLNTQQKLRTYYLNCLLAASELSEMKTQLESKKGITLQWYGVPMPEPVLNATFNAKLHNYKNLLADLQSERVRLSTIGLSEEKIGLVEKEGKIYKEVQSEELK